ncbi:MAG: tRNA (N6-threonylcarbamoyladenosine(37)-N6)-methyltransferase TrmO [Planctomycetaceae bacterium]|nr:tRNA (adenine(37)-N6)-methyltransferase [Planctomycetota bacterium]MCQ3948592.1 tRNA (N6-threonylcarbamoyladenosine(37)-N6)-methyltransferase TrmO [Planctomycetota bacterium]NUO16283.1 tRNA (N6-threonylcarbamoyladenosine(37)-N6)-methyltransferase TrmO [Planctomycetaceae bacterium]GIK52055.1 MAG: tRNA (N6-threonylcarbamoyladenosine(37)-N6)-methyltransferase TrmO [Planctomycetota bacterium]
MQRKKPAQDHTAGQTAPATFTCVAIGHVHSPYKERFGTPRQPVVTAQTIEDRALDARIELLPGMNFEQALQDLAGFEYIWVLAWLHLNSGWNPQVVPPRGPKVKRGLFATRAPHRPNPIGLSALRLIRVEGRVLHVRGIDLLDGTPVLDIKPYVPYSDAFASARAGWLEGLKQDEGDRYE